MEQCNTLIHELIKEIEKCDNTYKKEIMNEIDEMIK